MLTVPSTPPPSYDSVNQANERTPLTTGTAKRPGLRIYGVLMILFVLLLAQNTGLMRCPLNDAPAAEKEEIRRQWDRERNAHQAELVQWGREREEHRGELRAWEDERAVHRREHEHWLSERTEEEEAWRRKRDAWRKQQEQERWEEEKRQQAIREAFRLEREKEERQWQTARNEFEAERRGWRRQREEEERQWQTARNEFQAEREGWRRQREEEERHRLEVVRRSQGVYWTEPLANEHCHSYGARAYSSYLKDIPGDLNWLEVCNNMPPVVIHGREMSNVPHKCERDDKGEVIGVWFVDFDEPACKPYWNTIVDKASSNERTSLTTGVDKPRRISVYSLYGVFAILLALFVAQNAGIVRCPLNDVPAAEKAELRRQWGLERESHRTESAQWTRERREHIAELRVWEHERIMHREEREDWVRQRARDQEAWRKEQDAARQEEERRQQAARDAFERERQEEERQRQAARDAWKDECEGEERKRQEVRDEWKEEGEAEERKRQEVRDAWKEEGEAEERKRQEVRDAFERERADEERHRLEVVRRSQGVYWTEPHEDWRCHAYGTRIYTSYLRDIPDDLNWREVCDNMPPVVIHGREVSKPSKCERDNKGEVTGVWYIDFDEPSCQPYWGDIADKGCISGQTGFQRLEARLDGMSKGADWNMMCTTTAATIHGVHFKHPTTCEDRGKWGMVGIWHFPNVNCL
ncbi:hypothetical protein TRAPUB_7340 [Trametes pubescens]|uniref:Uncharacterized protein n=1 Tax=Trametes pubescens TaxID=154538 RepID=A0A1M2W6K1_TRAPU|nr:hypothetical protein TRAPUB_7340 [Trametes pubescens]